jgi:5-methylcytosine-specific restriction endonuclease McrA
LAGFVGKPIREVEMTTDGNSYAWVQGDDPFREDFFLPPHEEEIEARAEQIAADNRDAIRHYVELLIWETQDNPDLRKIVVSLLYHWDDVDPRWLAEASFMSVGDVRDLAESQPIVTFHCLDCGVQLQLMNRRHLIRMHYSLRALRRGEIEDERLADLLCKTCIRQRKEHAEDQRRLDGLRQQALLAEYRKKPYVERRGTQEWALLKRQVHRRDRYRCRLCGCDDAPLHVHHCTYANYAEERLEDLITLCSRCHKRYHFPEAS